MEGERASRSPPPPVSLTDLCGFVPSCKFNFSDLGAIRQDLCTLSLCRKLCPLNWNCRNDLFLWIT